MNKNKQKEQHETHAAESPRQLKAEATTNQSNNNNMNTQTCKIEAQPDENQSEKAPAATGTFPVPPTTATDESPEADEDAKSLHQAAPCDNTKLGAVETTLAPAKPVRVLPQVVVPGGSMSVTDSARQLYDHIRPTMRLFIKGDKVTQLVRDEDGKTIFKQVTPTEACSLLEEFVRFVKPAKGQKGAGAELVPTTIAKELADQYLNCRARTALPIVRGILNCPMITEREGRIHIVQSGYDAVTGMYVDAEEDLPETTLEEAVECLTGMLGDFEFQTPGDRSRALAELITPALKFGGFLKDPIPLSVAEADKSQSGKTYRQQMTAAIYNEDLRAATKKDGVGVGSMEEALGTLLAEGRAFIQLDNMRGKVNSQLLEAFLTAKGSILVRPAYSKQISADPSKHILFANSNGYQATIDLTNRSVITRIKKVEGVEFRDMLRFIQKNQPLILALVFEVVKEWHRQGKNKTAELGHDFREWCQTLDWIVQNIFKSAPLMDGHRDAQKRASSPAFSMVRELGLLVRDKNLLGHGLLASEIANLCKTGNVAIPGLAHDLRDDDGARAMAVGKVMAELFGDQSNIATIEGVTIVRASERVVGDSGKSFDKKTYSFTVPTDQPV